MFFSQPIFILRRKFRLQFLNTEFRPTEAPSLPRLCHIKTDPDFSGYGFNLHTIKGRTGQFVGKVSFNEQLIINEQIINLKITNEQLINQMINLQFYVYVYQRNFKAIQGPHWPVRGQGDNSDTFQQILKPFQFFIRFWHQIMPKQLWKTQ